MTPPRPSWPCPVCQATGGKTDEHVLTRWQHDMFDEPSLGLFLEGQELTRPYIVLRVCEPCQRWLNITFEQPTQALITALYADPQAMPLLPAELDLLSAYATKQVMLTSRWAQNLPERQRLWNSTLRTADYSSWRNTGRPLPGTKIWLGRVTDDSSAVREAVFRVLPGLREPVTPPLLLRAGDSIEGFSFGPLVVIWMRSFQVARGARGVSAGERFVRRAERGGLLLRARPRANGQVFWPPPLSFDVTTHERFRLAVGYRGD